MDDEEDEDFDNIEPAFIKKAVRDTLKNKPKLLGPALKKMHSAHELDTDPLCVQYQPLEVITPSIWISFSPI